MDEKKGVPGRHVCWHECAAEARSYLDAQWRVGH